MYRRYSDISTSNQPSNDFVERIHRPGNFVTALLFTMVLVILVLAAFYFAKPEHLQSLIAISAVTVISLCIFTIITLHRNKSIISATEFQNALFAGAAAIKNSFYMIASREDGSIVYFSPSYRSVMGSVHKGGIYSVAELFSVGSVSELDKDKFLNALKSGGSESIIFKINNGSEDISLALSVNFIRRPKGFSKISAIEISNSHDSDDESFGFISQSAAKLEGLRDNFGNDYIFKVINHLNIAAFFVSPDGNIESSSEEAAKMLGYASVDELANKSLSEVITKTVAEKILSTKIESESSSIDAVMLDSEKNFVKASIDVIPLEEYDSISGYILLCAPKNNKAQKKSLATSAPKDLTSKAQADYIDFIDSSPIAVALVSENGGVTKINDSFAELNSLSGSLNNKTLYNLIAEENHKELSELLSMIAKGSDDLSVSPINVSLTSDSGAKTASVYINKCSFDSSLLVHMIDTTEQKNLEMRFSHSQKMQAVGQLAGGIAHDFNNLLTAMIGFCDLLLMRHPAGDPSFADIMQIKQNASRAANLVRQLLAFSRRQTLQPKVLPATDILAELSNLVRRLIGENIELKMVHGRDLGMIKVDQGQFEQVIINLAVNARDAMQDGGVLTIRTSNTKIDKSKPLPKNLFSPTEEDIITEGEYVLIEIIDTGHGIPKDVLPKIFEPFFSTKEVGSGTGLGLATVYGIIKQTGGYIYVDSKENVGTAFNIYFPRNYDAPESEASDNQDDSADKNNSDLTGNGTILLVEDEAPVRIFSARALRNKGYIVLEADSGENGLEVFEKHKDEIDIIITDVIMPGMNGPTMVEHILKQNPKLTVIFMSGYAEDAFINTYGSEREFNFLPKPFTLKQLAGKVKEVTTA